MANPIQIRPWSRLGSLRSPQSNLKSQTEEPQSSLKPTTNTSSHENNESATKTLPNQSPNLKLTTPTTFIPPSKLKVESHIGTKISLEEQETIEKPNGNASLTKESEETKKENETKGSGTSFITISGENRGAYMRITQSHKKTNHKGEKVRTLSSPPMKAMYVNSNVQCVNNSMVFKTSLTHHDPGVHLIIPNKPIGEGFHIKKHVGSQRN